MGWHSSSSSLSMLTSCDGGDAFVARLSKPLNRSFISSLIRRSPFLLRLSKPRSPTNASPCVKSDLLRSRGRSFELGRLKADEGRWNGVSCVVLGLIPIAVNGRVTGSFSSNSASSSNPSATSSLKRMASSAVNMLCCSSIVDLITDSSSSSMAPGGKRDYVIWTRACSIRTNQYYAPIVGQFSDRAAGHGKIG